MGDSLEYFRLRDEQALSWYFRTWSEAREFFVVPRNEISGLHEEALGRRVQELLNVEETLNREKRRYGERSARVSERNRQAEEKEILLKDVLVKLESFLQKNRSRSQRAAETVEKERERMREKDAEVTRLLDTVDKLELLKTRTEGKVRRNATYMRFLEDVAKCSDRRTHSADLPRRYHLLLAVQEEFVRRQESLEEEAIGEEEERERLLKVMNGVMDRKNALSRLLLELDRQQSRTEGLRSEMERIRKTCASLELEAGTLRMSVLGAFLKVSGRPRVPDLGPHESRRQLRAVGNSMEDVAAVIDLVRRFEASRSADAAAIPLLTRRPPRRTA